MTPLEKLRAWLATYEGYNILDRFQVDYTDQIPSNGAVYPSGLVEIQRRKDIFGNVTISNQYNFALHYVFEKAPNDDVGATMNADWVMDFQTWIQEQSAAAKAPVFGDVPADERITAQNGVLYESTEEGLAIYMVQLSIQFTKKIEVKNKWLI